MQKNVEFWLICQRAKTRRVARVSCLATNRDHASASGRALDLAHESASPGALHKARRYRDADEYMHASRLFNCEAEPPEVRAELVRWRRPGENPNWRQFVSITSHGH